MLGGEGVVRHTTQQPQTTQHEQQCRWTTPTHLKLAQQQALVSEVLDALLPQLQLRTDHVTLVACAFCPGPSVGNGVREVVANIKIDISLLHPTSPSPSKHTGL